MNIQRATIGGGGDITCNTCQAVLPPGTDPCTNCGRHPGDPADPTWAPATPASGRPSYVGVVILFIVLAVIAALIYFGWRTNGFGLLNPPKVPVQATSQPAPTAPEATIAFTPATAQPTSVPRATAAPPNPTLAPTMAPSSTGFVLFQYGLITTDQMHALEAAYPGWKFQSYGSNDSLPFYKALIDVAAKQSGKVVILTTGRDAASPNGYTLDAAANALKGKDFVFLVLKTQGDDSSLYPALISDRAGGAVVVSNDPKELLAKAMELLK